MDFSNNSIRYRNPLPPGTRLNEKYSIRQILRITSTGIYYMTFDEQLRQNVCIKEIFIPGICSRLNRQMVEINPQFLGYWNDSLGRLRHAIQVIGTFDHEKKQGIPAVKDMFEENNTFYIAMEYVEGKPIREIIRKQGVWTQPQIRKYFSKIVDALGEYHRKGIAFGLLIPDQLVLTREGYLRLNDIGGILNPTAFHGNFIFPGTKSYIPAEFLNPFPLPGSRSDVYSLAAIFYYCMKGTRVVDVYARRRRVPLGEMEYASIEKALAMKPDQRFPHIPAFCHVFFRDHNRIQDKKQKKKKILFFLLAYAAFLAAEIGVFHLVAGQKNEYLSVNSDGYYKKEDEVQYSDIDFSQYKLVNADNKNLVLGISGDSLFDGAAFVLKEDDGDTGNLITLTDQVLGDYYFNLTTSLTGKYVTTRDSADAGSQLVQESYLGSLGTGDWKLIYAGQKNQRDVFLLENSQNMVLSPEKGTASEGQPVVLAKMDPDSDAQKWYLVYDSTSVTEKSINDTNARKGSLTDLSGTYDFVSCMDGSTKLVGLTSGSGDVLGVLSDAWNQQPFELEYDSGSGCYHIRWTGKDDAYLTLQVSTAQNGKDTVVLSPKSAANAQNQLFRIGLAGDDSYYIVNYKGTCALGFNYSEKSMDNHAIYCLPTEQFTDSRRMKWYLEVAE